VAEPGTYGDGDWRVLHAFREPHFGALDAVANDGHQFSVELDAEIYRLSLGQLQLIG
jgi:hypothetical protein